MKCEIAHLAATQEAADSPQCLQDGSDGPLKLQQLVRGDRSNLSRQQPLVLGFKRQQPHSCAALLAHLRDCGAPLPQQGPHLPGRDPTSCQIHLRTPQSLIIPLTANFLTRVAARLTGKGFEGITKTGCLLVGSNIQAYRLLSLMAMDTDREMRGIDAGSGIRIEIG